MRYIIRRILLSVFTLFAIVTVTFFLMHLVPGGPFAGSKQLPPTVLHNLEAKYGLNRPLIIQYGDYLKAVCHGDLGVSVKQQGRSVSELILSCFPVSAGLGFAAMVFAIVIGTALGVLSARRNGQSLDRFVRVLATIGTSVPSFVLATVTLILFGVMLRWVPTYGLDTPQSYILPAFSLSLFPLSFIARLMRSSMLEVIGSDYIRAARAKGIRESRIILVHAMKNAVLPVVTYIGNLAAGILTGSFVIEKIFSIPGLGSAFVESVQNRDYPLIMGTTVFYGALLMAAYLIVDFLYLAIDPRIKLSRQGD